MSPRRRPPSHRAVPRGDRLVAGLRVAAIAATAGGVLAYAAGLPLVAGALVVAGAGLLLSYRCLLRARELRALGRVRVQGVVRIADTRPRAVDG